MEKGKLVPSSHTNLCKKSRLCMIALLVLDVSPLSLVGLLTKALFNSNSVVGYSLTGPYWSLTKLKKRTTLKGPISLPVSSGFQTYSTEGRQTYEAGFGIKQWGYYQDVRPEVMNSSVSFITYLSQFSN